MMNREAAGAVIVIGVVLLALAVYDYAVSMSYATASTRELFGVFDNYRWPTPSLERGGSDEAESLRRAAREAVDADAPPGVPEAAPTLERADPVAAALVRHRSRLRDRARSRLQLTGLVALILVVTGVAFVVGRRAPAGRSVGAGQE
ncbi:MAG: hypothetical protein ACOC8E_05800 [Planctomycetota bacterium]